MRGQTRGSEALFVGSVDVPEAPVELTEHSLVCTGEGWFVVNAREMRWYESEGWGKFSNFGGDTVFDQLGFGITVLGAGQPLSMYHWQTDQEDFLVLSGEATLAQLAQRQLARRCRPRRTWLRPPSRSRRRRPRPKPRRRDPAGCTSLALATRVRVNHTVTRGAVPSRSDPRARRWRAVSASRGGLLPQTRTSGRA